METAHCSPILLIRVSEANIDRLRELRDFVSESLQQSILILPEDASAEVMELPSWKRMELAPTEQLPTESAEFAAESMPEGMEKRKILQRLTAYRAAHGLGCLKAVAGATRTKGRINDNTLRMILTGDAPPLAIEDWRRIDRALQRLESKCEESASQKEEILS